MMRAARLARVLAATAPMVVSLATLPASPALAQQAHAGIPDRSPVRQFGRVSYDARSLMIDGRRQIIWAGEFHPFRLPSPDLWRDVLQKMKASGFNTVSIYVDWGYHSPAPGVYDFSGIRDIDRLLTMAEEEGLYVITRVGPYINAELSRGGFPGWLVNQNGQARTDAPDYLAAVDEWLTRIDAIVARHQINGDGAGHKGTVILHQIENELAATTPAQRRYMDHLYARTRADGITVPLFHNDQGREGRWVPEGSGVARVVDGPNDLYAFDGYPGGNCTVAGEPTRKVPAPDWGYYGTGGARGGASASPKTPGFIAEIGGGWFDYWGSNGGYECTAVQRGRRFQRVFYGTNLANGIAIQSVYMTYGGTSWGWLPAPVVFTSYDYGAAISESRELRDKALEMKQLGGLIASVPDLAGMVPAGRPEVSSPGLRVYHNRNPETDARFLMVTHQPSNAQGRDAGTITADLPDGRYAIPVEVNGFDAKWLVAGVNLAGQRLVYSSSELQSAQTIGKDGLILLYGRAGEPGETVLRYGPAPKVTVLAGQVRSTFDPARGDLRLDYLHQGRAIVRIEGGGRPALTLILADEAEAVRYWRAGTEADPVLVRGPDLVRTARRDGGRLILTGDTRAATPLEVWAAPGARSAVWNGAPVALRPAPGGALASTAPLSGPAPVILPRLGQWRSADGSPEAAPGFDDSGWQAIGSRSGSNRLPRADGQPDMAMDAYGFHEGDVWYRGRYQGSEAARELSFAYGGGGAGFAQVWLDGRFIGEHEIPAGLPRPITLGAARIALPDSARTPGEHVIAIMVRSNGHNWDLDADDFHKESRGLVQVSLARPEGPSFAVPVAWKIQGARGGETLPDPARGVANNGGLAGERLGWHLPRFDDRGWPVAGLPAATAPAGTRWYRTSFRLSVPPGQDATLGVAFGDTTKPRSPGHYRVLVFVNGWNMGQFIAHVGPQRVFPVPEGILDHRGDNVIALAVSSDGAPQNALEDVQLVTLRNVKGGLPVAAVKAPASPAELAP
jgi:beta-galactosidase GanA